MTGVPAAPDAGTLLIRALRMMAAAIGCAVRTESIVATPWASVTFTGTRYRIAMAAAPCAALAAWFESLPEATFALPGHLVADFVVAQVETQDGVVRPTFEILTLIDA